MTLCTADPLSGRDSRDRSSGNTGVARPTKGGPRRARGAAHLMCQTIPTAPLDRTSTDPSATPSQGSTYTK